MNHKLTKGPCKVILITQVAPEIWYSAPTIAFEKKTTSCVTRDRTRLRVDKRLQPFQCSHPHIPSHSQIPCSDDNLRRFGPLELIGLHL